MTEGRESIDPGAGVEVHGIDKRAVDIEDDGMPGSGLIIGQLRLPKSRGGDRSRSL